MALTLAVGIVECQFGVCRVKIENDANAAPHPFRNMRRTIFCAIRSCHPALAVLYGVGFPAHSDMGLIVHFIGNPRAAMAGVAVIVVSYGSTMLVRGYNNGAASQQAAAAQQTASASSSDATVRPGFTADGVPIVTGQESSFDMNAFMKDIRSARQLGASSASASAPCAASGEGASAFGFGSSSAVSSSDSYAAAGQPSSEKQQRIHSLFQDHSASSVSMPGPTQQERDRVRGLFQDQHRSDSPVAAAGSSPSNAREAMPIVPAHCYNQDRSLVSIFGGSVTCGNAGIVVPVLIDGDCPVSACILKYGGDGSTFGGPLNF